MSGRKSGKTRVTRCATLGVALVLLVVNGCGEKIINPEPETICFDYQGITVPLTSMADPHFIPHGKVLLQYIPLQGISRTTEGCCEQHFGAQYGHVSLGDLQGNPIRQVDHVTLHDVGMAQVSHTGEYIALSLSGTVWVAPIVGDSVDFDHAIRATDDQASFGPSWSPDDSLIYYYIVDSGIRVCNWRQSHSARSIGQPWFRLPGASPDGKSVACFGQDSGGMWGLVVLDLRTNKSAYVARADMQNTPVWTPDGRHIVFDSGVAPAGTELRVVQPNGMDDRILWNASKLGGQVLGFDVRASAPEVIFGRIAFDSAGCYGGEIALADLSTGSISVLYSERLRLQRSSGRAAVRLDEIR